MLSVNLLPSFELVWCRREFTANISPLASNFTLLALATALPRTSCGPWTYTALYMPVSSPIKLGLKIMPDPGILRGPNEVKYVRH